MGLLDFAANIGKKLFPASVKPEEAASKIKQEIDAAKLDIKNLGVSMEGQTCHLSGECADFTVYQKAVLIAGNIEGVANVEAKGLKINTLVANVKEPEVEYYLIQKGDNLSKIAKQFYGDANKYPKIFEANKEVIKDPDLIFPGQKIRIPKLDA